jgi:hypothetical protein
MMMMMMMMMMTTMMMMMTTTMMMMMMMMMMGIDLLGALVALHVQVDRGAALAAEELGRVGQVRVHVPLVPHVPRRHLARVRAARHPPTGDAHRKDKTKPYGSRDEVDYRP